ncbi:cytospin-A-like isoform X2 [Cynoglossus semilaevis]|uniref:cytospin-A-like isoform X2 n=1 Tax=Cynoglossus semilaevis TaxID=244447 RepID=UPI0007DC931B|nr:cytospin-A-like isoform X2 [Cynoglossus semilaevis]
MGNHSGKDNQSHGLTGSPLDFFQTPPTTPSEADLANMAFNKAQTPSLTGGTTPSAAPPIPDCTQKVSAPTEWALISVESNVSDAAEAAAHETAAGSTDSTGSPPASRGSSSEQSWQERDSGLDSQAAAETEEEEEMTLVLLSLMEHQRASLGLSPNPDLTAGAVELLRHLITETDELVEEVETLKETLRTERLEWQQFQSDLQVAVSVADRLRSESEQALVLLQENHRTTEEYLSQALSRQQETDRELETLRAEHRDVCRQLEELQKAGRAEVDALGNKDKTETESVDSEERRGEEEQGDDDVETETEDKNVETKESEGERNVEAAAAGLDLQGVNGSGNTQPRGKRVVEEYLRCLAAQERRKEEGRGQRDPRRIVMLSERSLSRLPLPLDSSCQSDSAKNTSTTLPLCKKGQPTKGRRMDRVLQRQDSWSSFSTAKQEEEPSSDYIKPQDGFSALLRRHGGSRRNSLLRWCQTRTQGYKNIEITNFSSSWEDGLAFCAVYHTYLPNHIPYHVLQPEDKRENLDLAFKTGENVGITASLTVEEMLKSDGPDWQRVLGYVESIFRHFEM